MFAKLFSFAPVIKKNAIVASRLALRIIFAVPVRLFRKPVVFNSINYENFEVNMNLSDISFKEPVFNELNQSYVLIRNLIFSPQIILNQLEKFENLIKWKDIRVNFSTILRNYPHNFFVSTPEIVKEKFFIKLPEQTNKLEEKQINIAKKIKVTEEIIKILPYSRILKRQKLFKLPISRSPLYKSYFSGAEMKKFREILATQNKLRWSNVEVHEIYDKFNVKLFSDIRQISSSRNLLCYPNITGADLKTNKGFYYLIIGKRRDTNETIKALSKPIITQADYKN